MDYHIEVKRAGEGLATFVAASPMKTGLDY